MGHRSSRRPMSSPIVRPCSGWVSFGARQRSALKRLDLPAMEGPCTQPAHPSCQACALARRCALVHLIPVEGGTVSSAAAGYEGKKEARRTASTILTTNDGCGSSCRSRRKSSTPGRPRSAAI